jgi:hypothetical protein
VAVALTWSGTGELKTLHKAEWRGGLPLPGGGRSGSGFRQNKARTILQTEPLFECLSEAQLDGLIRNETMRACFDLVAESAGPPDDDWFHGSPLTIGPESRPAVRARVTGRLAGASPVVSDQNDTPTARDRLAAAAQPRPVGAEQEHRDEHHGKVDNDRQPPREHGNVWCGHDSEPEIDERVVLIDRHGRDAEQRDRADEHD